MSGKKRFELHQVLSYRTDIEKVRRQEFAAAKRDHDEACDHLERRKHELQLLNREFMARHGQFDSIVELQMYQDFFTRKREEIKEQQERIAMLERVLEERRQQMVHATKEKKVLEALKEKQEAAFRQHQHQKEREFMDEISVQKKGRD